MSVFYNRKLLSEHGAQGLRAQRQQDMQTLQHAPTPEIAKMNIVQMHQTHRAAMAAGFRGLDDDETLVPGKTFLDNTKEITQCCNLAAHLVNRRVRTTSKEPETAARNALKRELNAVGFTLSSQRRRIQGAVKPQRPGRPGGPANRPEPQRERMYRIVPVKRVADLEPHFRTRDEREWELFDGLEPKRQRVD